MNNIIQLPEPWQMEKIHIDIAMLDNQKDRVYAMENVARQILNINLQKDSDNE